MKNRFSSAVVLFVFASILAGCGRRREEAERQRIEAEKQAQRDIQKANKAIGDIGKKIGRKVPLMDFGLSPEKNIEPVPASKAVRKP